MKPITAPQRIFLQALTAPDLASRKKLMFRVRRSYTRLQHTLLDRGLVDIIRTPNPRWLRDDQELVITEAGRAALAAAGDVGQGVAS